LVIHSFIQEDFQKIRSEETLGNIETSETQTGFFLQVLLCFWKKSTIGSVYYAFEYWNIILNISNPNFPIMFYLQSICNCIFIIQVSFPWSFFVIVCEREEVVLKRDIKHLYCYCEWPLSCKNLCYTNHKWQELTQ